MVPAALVTTYLVPASTSRVDSLDMLLEAVNQILTADIDQGPYNITDLENLLDNEELVS